jgi:hypothetical protein
MVPNAAAAFLTVFIEKIRAVNMSLCGSENNIGTVEEIFQKRLIESKQLFLLNNVAVP